MYLVKLCHTSGQGGVFYVGRKCLTRLANLDWIEQIRRNRVGGGTLQPGSFNHVDGRRVLARTCTAAIHVDRDSANEPEPSWSLPPGQAVGMSLPSLADALAWPRRERARTARTGYK